jgi:hypothetical protein
MKDFEFEAGYNTHIGEVNLNIGGNFTTVKNEVLKLYEATPLGDEFGRIEEGYSMFYLWGYKTGGIFQSQEEIDNWRKTHADVTVGQDLLDPSIGYQYKPGDMYFRDVHGDPTDPKQQYSPTPDSLIKAATELTWAKQFPAFIMDLILAQTGKVLI